MHRCSHVTEDTRTSPVSRVGWCPPAFWGEGGDECRRINHSRADRAQSCSISTSRRESKAFRRGRGAAEGDSSRRSGITHMFGGEGGGTAGKERFPGMWFPALCSTSNLFKGLQDLIQDPGAPLIGRFGVSGSSKSLDLSHFANCK